MGLGYETNFYIRKDQENLLWSGISISIPDEKFNSYKLSCYISKKNNGLWKMQQSDFIIFDIDNNMYKVNIYNISQLYNTNAKDKDIQFTADISKPEDEYAKVETKSIYLNELLLKKIIDEFKTKTEHSFGVKITI